MAGVQRLPDFLIVGAAKSGTTSLYHYLRQHPQIFLPSAKECWFFAFAKGVVPDEPIFSRVSLITSLADYTAQFEDASPAQVVGECSTAYLHLWRQTIPNIREAYGDRDLPGIVILLRNPIERAYSHYMFDSQEGFLDDGFEESIEACLADAVSPYNNYLTYGLYSEQIAAYSELFPRVSVHTTDDLARDPAGVVGELLRFLRVDPSVRIDTDFRANISGKPARRWLVSLVVKDNALKRAVKPFLKDTVRQKVRTLVLERSVRREPMSETAADRLRQFYHSDVERLSRLIGRDLGEWLR